LHNFDSIDLGKRVVFHTRIGLGAGRAVVGADLLLKIFMSAGRPLTWDSVEALEKAVDGYFEYIKGEFHEEDEVIETKSRKKGEDNKSITIKTKIWDREPEPPTITGLSLYLGFESRQSFHDYKERPEFSYAIKRARLRIENEYEKMLYRQSPTGSIFALKNLGWVDKQEVEQKTTVKDERIDPSKLTDDELRTLAELQRKSGVS
jgi:hypothetical protein